MFGMIKRKIKQGKGKKLRRKNLLFEALVSRGKEAFAEAKSFTKAKLDFATAKEGHNKIQLSSSPWRRLLSRGKGQ